MVTLAGRHKSQRSCLTRTPFSLVVQFSGQPIHVIAELWVEMEEIIRAFTYSYTEICHYCTKTGSVWLVSSFETSAVLSNRPRFVGRKCFWPRQGVVVCLFPKPAEYRQEWEWTRLFNIGNTVYLKFLFFNGQNLLETSQFCIFSSTLTAVHSKHISAFNVHIW